MRRPLLKKIKHKPRILTAVRGYLRHKAQAASVANNCRVLSGAHFAGRGSGQPGALRASLWIARKALAMGLAAWHGRLNIFQPVPLGTSTPKPCSDGSSAFLQSESGRHDLSCGDELLIRSQHAVIEVTDTPLIFVGFGIVAAEYLWDDYANLDVVGKVVIVLPNDPGRQNSTGHCFHGERMTYYGRWEYKYEEAARQGAAGVIIVHTDELFGCTFGLVREEMQRPFRFRPGGVRSRLTFEGICSELSGRKLLSRTGVDLEDFLATDCSMANRIYLSGACISMRLSFDVKTQHCRNVLGMAKGKLFPRQCILLCAHFDHLGNSADRTQSRSYYPGAVDNAMGVSVLLELAKRLEIGPALNRTVLFAWTTAEEVGMHGSAQVARLIEATGLDVIAALNVDGFVPIDWTRDLGLVDGDQSDLPDAFIMTAKRLNRRISLDDEPSAGYFYRSDQASFAKINIPAVQITTGSDLMKGGVTEGLRRHHLYDSTLYHTTRDVFDRHWNFSSICADIDVIHQTVIRLANSSARPTLRHPNAPSKR